MRPVGSPSTRLVVLRGNSGSGKTTVAHLVRATTPGFAVVSQDVLRRDVLKVPDVAGNLSVGLIDTVARYALDQGMHVVVEGILHAARYGPMLRTLAGDHLGTTRTYVFDVPFDETLRRHGTKPRAADFGEQEMREWWHGLQLVDGLVETVIDASTSAAAAARQVVRDCRL